MSTKKFILVTGRTSKQAKALHQGKESAAYRRAVALVEMNQDDMARLEITAGQTVGVSTPYGETEVKAQVGKLPPGMIFMPLGPWANALADSDTQGTGMPGYEGLEAEVKAA